MVLNGSAEAAAVPRLVLPSVPQITGDGDGDGEGDTEAVGDGDLDGDGVMEGDGDGRIAWQPSKLTTATIPVSTRPTLAPSSTASEPSTIASSTGGV